eukprot:12881604-Prorocentrum_lima.AAC.1
MVWLAWRKNKYVTGSVDVTNDDGDLAGQIRALKLHWESIFCVQQPISQEEELLSLVEPFPWQDVQLSP